MKTTTLNEIKRKLETSVLLEEHVYMLGNIMDLLSDYEIEEEINLNDYKITNIRYINDYCYIRIELYKNSDLAPLRLKIELND